MRLILNVQTPKIFSYLILVFVATCFSCQQNKIASNEAYESILQKAIDKGYPGIILAIDKTNDQTWIGSSGFSNIETAKPMLENERFHIASVTKIFTAVGVLKLIDAGKLSLKDKAIKYLDTSLVNSIPYIDQITIAQLLDHSSGIYSFNNDMTYIETLIGSRAFEDVEWSSAQLISLTYGDRAEPQGRPGTGSYYADINYILLGLIIESVSGVSFRYFIKENIFNPLGLRHTGFYSKSECTDPFELTATAQGYLKKSEDLDRFITIHTSFKEVAPGVLNTSIAGEEIDAAAGIVSTAQDLITFGKALYKQNFISTESLGWLLSIGNNIDKEELNTKRQGIVTVYNKPYGVLYTSLGDGPGGMNTMLAYHPASGTIVVAFVNIFGNFDEHDFFLDEIVDSVLKHKQ